MTGSDGLTPASMVVVAPGVLSTELGSEQVMLNLADGTYYGLNEVGSEIWKRLQTPASVAEICEAIEEVFEVDDEVCFRDVVRLLDELIARGLVERRSST